MTTFLRRGVLALALAGLTQVAAFAGEGWSTDYAKALATAKAEKKNVLLDFTGSDWCPPCKAMEKQVLSNDKFLDVAKKNFVLVTLDYPRSKPQTDEVKKQNEGLAKKYNIEGFPTLVVITPEEKVLATTSGYDPSAGLTGVLEQLKPGLLKN